MKKSYTRKYSIRYTEYIFKIYYPRYICYLFAKYITEIWRYNKCTSITGENIIAILSL